MQIPTVEASCSNPRAPTVHYLRWAGTGMLLLAVIDFLCKGVVDTLPAYRYNIALLFSALLAGCGLFCGYRWRDLVGARWFFMLAAACIPVQFSQIGAMTVDMQLPWAKATPEAANEVHSAFPLIVGNILLTLAVTWPIATKALRLLARAQADKLRHLLFWGCAALLLPHRGAPVAPLVLFCLYIFNTFQTVRHLRTDPMLRSWEETAATIIAWLPLLILWGRSTFYAVDPMEMAFLAALISAMSCINAVTLSAHKLWRYLCFYASMTTGTFAWVMLVVGLVARYSFTSPAASYMIAIPVSVFWYGLAEGIPELRRRFRLMAAALIFLAVVPPLFGDLDLSRAAVALLSGIGLAIVASRDQARWPMVYGLLAALSGLLRYVSGLQYVYVASPWLSMAGSGIAILLLASYFETHGSSLRQRWWAAWQAWHRWC